MLPAKLGDLGTHAEEYGKAVSSNLFLTSGHDSCSYNERINLRFDLMGLILNSILIYWVQNILLYLYNF